MKMAWLVVLWVLCCQAVAPAADAVVVLLPDGTAWFSPGGDAPTILVKHVIRAPGAPPAPGPGDTPSDPQPPEGSTLQRDVKALADAVDDSLGATMLSKTYELLAEYVASGKIPSDADSVDKALTAAVNEAVKMTPGRHATKWDAFNTKVGDLLTAKLIASGGKLTAAEWSQHLRDVSAGLAASTDQSAVPPFLEPLLAALVQLLVELLSDMFDRGA